MRRVREWPIRIQLAVLALSTLLILLVLLLFSYVDSIRAFNTNARESARTQMLQTERQVEQACRQMAVVTYNLAYNTTTQDFLLTEDPEEKLKLNTTKNSLFETVRSMNAHIVDIRVYPVSGTAECLALLDATEEMMAVSRFGDGPGRVFISAVRPYRKSRVDYDTLMVAAPIRFSGNRTVKGVTLPIGTRIGTMVVLFDTEILSALTALNPDKALSGLVLLDRADKPFPARTGEPENKRLLEVAASMEAGGTSSLQLQSSRFHLASGDLTPIQGKMVSVINETLLTKPLAEARKRVFLLFSGALLLLMVPFALITDNMVRPLKILMRFMSAIREGNLKQMKTRVSLIGYAEMERLATDFNEMLDEMDNLTRRLLQTSSHLYETELAKKQSELSLLQSQINPHFLYNTLQSVKGMAQCGNMQAVCDTVQSLGVMLRYGIRRAEMSMLGDELTQIGHYIQIQQTRFSHRFSVEYEIEPGLSGFPVPRMVLQPLVENAITHGLEPKLEKGLLTLAVQLQPDGALEIRMKDDGAGMLPERLVELREALDTDRPACLSFSDGSGIGLCNVNRRLRLIYGEAEGIHLDSAFGTGTTVWFRVLDKENGHVQGAAGGR